MENEKILDINRSNDDNFNNLLNNVQSILKFVINPFLISLNIQTLDEFMKIFRYDFKSLCVTTMYNILYNIVDRVSRNTSKSEIIDHMTTLNIEGERDWNRKRANSMLNEFKKRNKSHLEYFHVNSCYEPKLLAADSPWYSFVSDNRIVKRFLLKDEAMLTKNFFNDLNSIYDEINKKTGYDRFYLFYKLETNSHLEMFYELLSLIKKEKRKRKLPSKNVNEMIDGLQHLHLIQCNHPDFVTIFESYKNIPVFSEMLNIPFDRKDLNGIVFNVSNLNHLYIEHPSAAFAAVNILNFINKLSTYYLSVKIEYELYSIAEKDYSNFIADIQHCDHATKYFNNYINTHIIVNTHKNCSNDITFTHFKRIYNLKSAY